MTSLEQFVAGQITSAAYHEAGHMTAAVVQGMPIRAAGLYVDLIGNGVAKYFDRPEKDLGATPLDARERKLTMIALFAGQVAQERFFSDCDDSYWSKDLMRIGTFSRQLHPEDEEAQIASRKELRGRAEKLVQRFWPIIEELSKTLLAKPCEPMPPEEATEGWGRGAVRHMSGEEIAEFFLRHHIKATIVSDAVTSYNSTQATPYYDSLA